MSMEWAKTPWFGICMLDMFGGLVMFFFPETRIYVSIMVGMVTVAGIGYWIQATFFYKGEYPSAKIEIDKKLDYHPGFQEFFMHGIVSNGDKLIEKGRIRLLDFSSNRTETVPDMNLQWQGGDTNAEDLPPWDKKTFDILKLKGHIAEFIGYEGKVVDIKRRVGDGVFSFTLRLQGNNVTKLIEQKFRIEVPKEGDPTVFEE